MALTKELKRKGKMKLYGMADDKERSELFFLDLQNVQEQVDELHEALAQGATKQEVQELLAAVSRSTDKMSTTYLKAMSANIDAMKEGHAAFLQSISSMHDSVKRQISVGEGGTKSLAGFFKDYSTLLTEQTGHAKRTAELMTNLKWNASMQVRTEGGSPMTPYGLGPVIADGTTTVTTAGTAVQISTTSVPCYGIYVTGHESNVGAVVVGASTVKAALTGRRGYTLYPTNAQKFSVTDANLLYVDAVNSGDKIHWYVERQF